MRKNRNSFLHVEKSGGSSIVSNAFHPSESRIVWLTGVPAAGKTTIAFEVARRLTSSGRKTVVLDGDQLRAGLCADLGFSEADRIENIRRVGELAALLYRQDMTVLCALVSPYRASRDRVRALVPAGCFLEVHVVADLDTCRARDPKGLYARASQGTLDALTGVSAIYEPPLAPELTIDTRHISPAAAGDLVMDLLQARGVVAGGSEDAPLSNVAADLPRAPKPRRRRQVRRATFHGTRS